MLPRFRLGGCMDGDALRLPLAIAVAVELPLTYLRLRWISHVRLARVLVQAVEDQAIQAGYQLHPG